MANDKQLKKHLDMAQLCLSHARKQEQGRLHWLRITRNQLQSMQFILDDEIDQREVAADELQAINDQPKSYKERVK